MLRHVAEVPSALQSLAERLAAVARAETLPRWRTGLEADNKDSEGSWDPVTEADRGSERAMRTLLEAEEPSHGVDGEEFPSRPAQGRFRWSLDPIDGTRAFVCGFPTWTTLIALLDDDRPVLGIIDAPALDELYLGTPGGSALIQAAHRVPLQSSGCLTLPQARVSTTDPFLFDAAGQEAFGQVRAAARTIRYGFDAYAYARLAAGSIDLVIESGLKTYDYHALIPVVRGAGGTFGDWYGGEDYRDGKVIAAASRKLYDAAVEIMSAA
ncbi:histidinol-phosphatase [Sphingomonas piscis]|uniref:Histidinol-phosphatase n=1 Tax=Sphingomonas piscis TaxID=2714943 RepID=A0A6G7YSX2_9SPHN|nr:histidinol-phosphatase [Sphingomonas piscis]